MAECPGCPPHSVVYLVKAVEVRTEKRLGSKWGDFNISWMGTWLPLRRALPASPLRIIQMTIQTSQVAQIVRSLAYWVELWLYLPSSPHHMHLGKHLPASVLSFNKDKPTCWHPSLLSFPPSFLLSFPSSLHFFLHSFPSVPVFFLSFILNLNHPDLRGSCPWWNSIRN